MSDLSQDHYDDTEMMRRWMYARVATKAKRGGQYLWAAVTQEFCVGSTTAAQVCVRHGYDPDVMVRRG